MRECVCRCFVNGKRIVGGVGVWSNRINEYIYIYIHIYNARNGSYSVVPIAESIAYPMWVICERFYNIHCGKEVCGKLCGVETDVECVWKVIVD